MQDPNGGAFTQIGRRTVLGELPLTDAQIGDLQDALAEQPRNEAGVGSDKVFGDLDWPISGKTGTAQNELDGSEDPHSWFASYGGEDGEATIASVVMVENIGEGVSYAAPATRLVYDWYIASGLATDTPSQTVVIDSGVTPASPTADD